MKKTVILLLFSFFPLRAQHLYQGGGDGNAGREDIAKKTAGWRYTPIPLVNYTSDDGLGYGMRVGIYEYDGKTVPYKRSYKAQVFMTTEGKWAHLLSMDVPNFFRGNAWKLKRHWINMSLLIIMEN